MAATTDRDRQSIQGIAPPGPRGDFLLGTMKESLDNPLVFYIKYWKEYGDYIRFRATPGLYWYLLVHPEAVEQVLQTHQQKYKKPDMFKKPMSLMVGTALLTSDGEFWMKQRRLAQPAFHRQRIAALGATISRCISESMQEWEQIPADQVVDVADLMTKMTLKVVGESLFSTDISDTASSFGPSLRLAFEHVNYKMSRPLSVPEWMPTEGNRAFRAAKKALDDVVDAIITQRRKDKAEKNDLLAMLLTATDEESGTGMTDEQLRNEVLTLLVAGHDTVSAALTWTFYLLGENPACAATLLDEVKSVLGGRDAAMEDMQKLPYTMMVFEESLRLYPPAWGQPREAKVDDVLGKYAIKKGTVISLCQYITHRHPEFWQNPEQFDPERFTPEKVAQRPRFAYFPFGGGQRMCIGNNLALMEGQLAVASIMQKYRFDLLPNQIVEADPTFVLRPRNGLKAYVRKRQ